MHGLVLIDKPQGCSSHDVVNRWRRLSGIKRTGHLGTLDPMATGLLCLLTGTATRLAQFFGPAEKTYEAEITLGLTSDSYDADGQVIETGYAIPSPDRIREALGAFVGTIEQVPPPVSAKKIDGQRAYKMVRKQIAVELPPVSVTIHELDILGIAPPRVHIRVRSSAGTYIRSIAHDLGGVLGCGGILSSLRRIASGPFQIEQARSLDELAAMAAGGNLRQAVIPSTHLLPDFPTEYVSDLTIQQIRQGRHFRTSPFSVPPGAPHVKAVSREGDLIAIGNLVLPNMYHAGIVL